MNLKAKTVYYNIDLAYDEFSGDVTDAVFIRCCCSDVADDVTFTRCTFIDCIDVDALQQVDMVIIEDKTVYIDLI